VRGFVLHRSFALFWVSRVLSTLAFQMQAVAVGWQLYALTGSPLDLGLVGLAQFLPMILLTLVVGQVADRYDRRLVAATCQLVEAAGAAALTLGTLGGWLDKPSILAIVFVVGGSRAFESPAMSSLVPRLVPLDVIPRAIARINSASQTARIVGPSLGGLLLALGPDVAYVTVCVLFLVASVLASRIRGDTQSRMREPLTSASVFSGILFIRNTPAILGAVSLDLFAVLLGGATALLPIYARDILGTGPWGLGLLRSAPGIGALLASLVLARHPIERRVGPVFFGAVIVFGVATIVFGLSTSLGLSMLALAVLGASDLVSVVIRYSLVQMRTPDEMRGRVSAVSSLFTGTSNQLGEFESGVTAALFGPVPAVLIGGIGTIAVALIWMRLFPDLRRIRFIV
jgi:MFS family permease